MDEQKLLTRIQELEEELHQLQLQRSAFGTIAEGIIVVDDDDKILFCNQAFTTMWQIPSALSQESRDLSSLRDALFQQMVSDESADSLHEFLSPHPSANQQDFQLANGRIYEQFFSAQEEDGASYSWSFRDVTRRRVLEFNARRNQQFFEHILKAAPIILYAIDRDGVVTFSQGKGLSRVGRRPNEWVGKNVFDVYQDHPMTRDLRKALNGLPVRVTHEFEGVYHEMYLSPLFDKQQQISGVIGLTIDVTDQRRGREYMREAKELRRARDKANAANMAKSSFVANMSHELRTPLNSIIGFSQFLVNDKTFSPKQQEYLSLIMRSSEHLLALINDILELSKIEAGHTQLNIDDFDFRELLESLDSIFRANAENKRLHFTAEFDEAIPRYLSGDRGKLRQILVNLLSNAIKYTRQGSVTLRVQSLELSTDTDPQKRYKLSFEVEDTGVGIARDELHLLFDPFSQTASGREQQTGTGLGLAIVKAFTDLMKGSIRVDTTLGHGTTFHIILELPAATVIPGKLSNPTGRVLRLRNTDNTPRILVVDDKWENRIMLARMMERVGFEVREAENGEEALHVWRDWQPNLIWMDMRMPVMDGYDATQKIRTDVHGSDPVIIALTASAFEHERTKVLAMGCDDFMTKPFREVELFDMVSRYLDVEFIYENEQEATPLIRDRTIFSNHLAQIPEEIQQSLRQAAQALSLHAVEKVANQIEPLDKPLADHIRGLAGEFDFQAITEALNSQEK